MITANISDFRKNIKAYFNKVPDNFETIFINRKKKHRSCNYFFEKNIIP